MAKLLYTIREHYDLPFDLWQRFREKAAEDNHSPTEALARLMRRYLEDSMTASQNRRNGATNRRRPGEHEVPAGDQGMVARRCGRLALCLRGAAVIETGPRAAVQIRVR